MLKILEKAKFGKLELKNRIIMPPMDIYEAKDGFANIYHRTHYFSRAIGGVGLIIQEATSVREDGRISMQDLGIWDDKFIPNLKEIVDGVHELGTYIGIQLNDAGRKAKLDYEAEILSASDIRFSNYYPQPKKMDKEDILECIQNFKNAAIRAKKIGYDYIEIHAAHGYLLNQFISPNVNNREDEYKDRYLLLKQVLEAIREVYSGTLGIRVSADEWVEEGLNPEDIANGLKDFENLFDIVHVSTGSTINDGVLPFYPGYQLRHAKKIKEILNKPVIGVGLIDNFDLAEFAIRDYGLDYIAVGRAILRNPNWIKEQCVKNKIDFKTRIAIDRSYFSERFIMKNIKR